MAGPAIDQTITHYAGDSLTITIGPVVDESGAAVDLGGATARWWMGKSPTAIGTDVYIKKSSQETQVDESAATINQIDIDRITTDEWTLTIHILPNDTETAPKAGTYYHEAEVVDADGHIATVTIGKYILKPTIVRNV